MAQLFILLGIFGRLLPHLPNVTPVGAVALIGGAKLNKPWVWVTPFIALLLSDVLLQLFFNVPAFSVVTPFIYGSFAINILLGRSIKGSGRYFKLGGFSLIGSLQFFLVTNLGVWFEGVLYAKTWAGLIECYTLALPFLRNTLVGDLAWSFGLFFIIERTQAWVQRRSLQTVSN